MLRGLLTDSVLGDVFIPLKEIDERAQIDTADSRHYSLSNTKTSQNSTGTIELSIGWRSTPLDRLTLHVKDLQQDLDDLEELLAILMAKEHPQQQVIQLSQIQRQSSEVPYGRSVTGKLEVKTVEAKNLSIPIDKLKTFANAGVYANLILERDSGKGVTFTTSPAKNRLSPTWKESFKYETVELTSTLVVQLFDIRRIRTNEFLGQTTIPIGNLKVRSNRDPSKK